MKSQHPVPTASPQDLRPVSAPYHRRKTLRSQRRLRTLFLETFSVLGIGLGLSGLAVTALTRLIPHALEQQAKLATLQAEVRATQLRVRQLQTDYRQDLQPESRERIAQQEGNTLSPNQRRVVWILPKSKGLPQP